MRSSTAFTMFICSSLLWLTSACKTVPKSGQARKSASLGLSPEGIPPAHELEGEWLSRCSLRSQGIYTRTHLAFSAADLVLSNRYFADAKCSKTASPESLAKAKIDANLTIKGSFKSYPMGKNNLMNIDIKFPKGTAFSVVKIEGQNIQFGKLCRKVDVEQGRCKVEAGTDDKHRARELDPLAVYSRP